jgi:hypothetical protein
MKTKTIITAVLMGIGLGLALLEFKTQQPNGVTLLVTGAMFGIGLHWYRRGLSFKTILAGALMAVTFPVAAGAVVMGQALLGLIAAVTLGTCLRMVK